MMKTIAFIAAIVLPLFNIPLIVRVIKRRSSRDLSIHWALGVWICFLLMAPEALRSSDIVWRVFSIMNIILFTCVLIAVVVYRKGE
jgi:carbon starvation protein CstA